MYIPGKSAPFSYSSIDKTMTSGGTDILGRSLSRRRKLSPEEYNYYYSFLAREDIADYVKVALSIVMIADLKLLYTTHYELNKDPVLVKWAELYDTYDFTTQMKAKGEIRDFDAYLKQPLGITEYADVAREKRESFIVNLLSEQTTAAKEKKMQELIQKEAQEFATKKKSVQEIQNMRIVNQAMKKYMRSYIRKYLEAYYNEHMLSLMMNQEVSDLEYAARMYIIEKVQNLETQPQYGIAAYINAMNYMVTGNNKTYMLTKIKADLGMFKHPLTGQVM